MNQQILFCSKKKGEKIIILQNVVHFYNWLFFIDERTHITIFQTLMILRAIGSTHFISRNSFRWYLKLPYLLSAVSTEHVKTGRTYGTYLFGVVNYPRNAPTGSRRGIPGYRICRPPRGGALKPWIINKLNHVITKYSLSNTHVLPYSPYLKYHLSKKSLP